MTRFSDIRGGYVYVTVDDVEYRVYYEEAGNGIPIILQHTASADNRQWRHLLEDTEITRNFRLIAHDLPYHGKSIPPVSQRWWEREYVLTKDFFEKCILSIGEAFALDRPVFMGCSMGGHLAIDLAIDHPNQFRAVIGLAAGLLTRPAGHLKMIEWYGHPRMSNNWKPSLMYTMMSPTSPENLRRETTFIYSQSSPTVFRGDLTYHVVEHDARATAHTIDTNKIPVYILGGEYDWSGTTTVCAALAQEIDGSYYRDMKQMGHFPMCENRKNSKNISCLYSMIFVRALNLIRGNTGMDRYFAVRDKLDCKNISSAISGHQSKEKFDAYTSRHVVFGCMCNSIVSKPFCRFISSDRRLAFPRASLDMHVRTRNIARCVHQACWPPIARDI